MHKIAIIENVEGIGDYFTRFLDPEEYDLYPVWDDKRFPEKDYEGYIFTGDRNNITDGLLDYHKKEIKFIKSIKNKKIFGSCFSHQLIGKIFGGNVENMKEGCLGWNKIIFKKDHGIFEGLNDPYFFHINEEELTTKPDSAVCLATSHKCRYQILKYGKNIITCQSHPEMLKSDAIKIIKDRKDELSEVYNDLDSMIKKSKKYSDDYSSKKFISNIIKWLLD